MEYLIIYCVTAQLAEIKKVTLAKVICDTIPDIKEIQKDVSLPQFSVSDYETLNKIETLLTGKLTWSFSSFFLFFFKCTSE